MSFEFFTQPGGSFSQEPTAHIFKKRIYLNRPTQRKYVPKNNQNVLLGFDKDKQQICVKFIDSPQLGSRKLRNGGISCKYFLDYFQIPRLQNYLEILEERSSLESGIIIQLKDVERNKK